MFALKRSRWLISPLISRWNWLFALVCVIIAENVAAGSPWTTHSRELVRKEDRKSAPSGGETSATLLPNHFRPKFSRYTPFMTEDSLPAPVFGRQLQRYRGSQPRANVKGDDEPGRPTTTRYINRGSRDSGENLNRPRTRTSSGFNRRNRARNSNERPDSKGFARNRSRPQKSHENVENNNKPNRYGLGVRSRIESKNSNEGSINRGPVKNRSSIRSPSSLTRPRKLSSEASGERNFRRHSSPSSEADSRQATAARRDHDRRPAKRGKEGNRSDRRLSSEFNFADRKATSENQEHRSSDLSGSDGKIDSVNQKVKHNSRESIVKNSSVNSGESKSLIKRQRESREEDSGSVKSKTLLFNGPNQFNANKIDSESSKIGDRITTMTTITLSAAVATSQTTPDTITTVGGTISSEIDEKNAKFRAGRLFNHRQLPSDEQIGRDRFESNNSSESVGQRHSTPTSTLSAADRSNERSTIWASDQNHNRAGKRTRAEEKKSATRGLPPLRSAESLSESDLAESQKEHPRKLSLRSSTEKVSESRKIHSGNRENRTISSDDLLERRSPPPPRQPPVAPPRLPPPPAPSQFFGDFAIPGAGQMFPQFGAPLGNFPSIFPFPGLNVPPPGRSSQALI